MFENVTLRANQAFAGRRRGKPVLQQIELVIAAESGKGRRSGGGSLFRGRTASVSPSSRRST